MPTSFVFDVNRCTGCHACRLACTIENELEPELSWRRIETFNPRRHPAAPLYHLSLACNHCGQPACMYACPTLAYSRDPSSGALLLDESKCMGCHYCAWACPYDAPVFDAARGTMTKCTFCAHRLLDGLKPACAALCPTGALDAVDLPEARLGADGAGLPVSGLEPRIRIEALRKDRGIPEVTAAPPAAPLTAAPSAPPEISLRSEWPLLLFTTLAASLVALTAAHWLSGLRVTPAVFLVGAAAALVAGAAHLGRIGRAYRAVLNVRRSWLSREIVALSTFFALGAVYVALVPDRAALGGIATLTGFVTLFAADRVYSVLTLARPAHRHSASVLLTGLFLTGLLADVVLLAGTVGVAKLALYLGRKIERAWRGAAWRPGMSVARLSFGLALPALLWVVDREAFGVVIVGAALVGELIDRGEYYEELERESPRRQLALALAGEIAAVQGASLAEDVAD